MAGLPPEHQRIIRTVWNAVTDLQTAIPLLKGQIDTNKTAINSATAASTNTTTSSETVIVSGSTIGLVNNQVGVTSYSTMPSDYGSFILFSDASPVAVTLSTLGSGGGIVLPFFCYLINEGVGLVTATPADGTISYPNNLAAANMPISQGEAALIIYDGANFTGIILPVSPEDLAVIAHQFVTGYNNVTGAFSTAQPAFSDLSGQINPSTQMPASGVTAGSYTLASLTVDAEGLVTAASNGPTGLSVTITTAQLTPTGTQGSQTFTNGVLTAQVPAT